VEIIILPSYDQVSREISNRIISAVHKKPDLVLGLATGKTMLGIYQKIVQDYKKGRVDLRKVKTFNLDEYIGFDSSDSVTFHSYMNKNFFSQVNIPPETLMRPVTNLKKRSKKQEGSTSRSSVSEEKGTSDSTNPHHPFKPEPGLKH